MWYKVNFKQNLAGLNSEFSFFKTGCHTKTKEPSLFYYLPLAGERIVGFKAFRKLSAQCENTNNYVPGLSPVNHDSMSTSEVKFIYKAFS